MYVPVTQFEGVWEYQLSSQYAAVFLELYKDKWIAFYSTDAMDYQVEPKSFALSSWQCKLSCRQIQTTERRGESKIIRGKLKEIHTGQWSTLAQPSHVFKLEVCLGTFLLQTDISDYSSPFSKKNLYTPKNALEIISLDWKKRKNKVLFISALLCNDYFWIKS